MSGIVPDKFKGRTVYAGFNENWVVDTGAANNLCTPLLSDTESKSGSDGTNWSEAEIIGSGGNVRDDAFVVNMLGVSWPISKRFRDLFRVEPKWKGPYQRTANIGTLYCKAPTYPGANMRYHRNAFCSGMQAAKGPYHTDRYFSICFTDADISELVTTSVTDLESRMEANIQQRNAKRAKHVALAQARSMRRRQADANTANMQRQADANAANAAAGSNTARRATQTPVRSRTPPYAASGSGHAKKNK